MSSFKLFGTELKSLKNKKGALIALIGVMLIPIVYSAVLLSSTWGPYDNLDNLPVAVVNQDAGAVSDGNPINVGNDLVATLKSSNTLGWDFVSQQEAQQGIESNKYYMIVQIPEDFSQKVTTVLTANPETPELKYIQNEGLNFMGAQVTNSAVERLREQLGDKITATYTTTLLAKFKDAGAGFTAASDGSNQIYTGTVKLSEGTNTLLSSLTEKAPDINKLADGAQAADTGAGTLLSSIQDGTKGVNDLAAGSAGVAAGATSVQAGANKLLAGTNQAQAGSAQLVTGIETKVLPGAQQIAGGLNQINANGAALSTGAQGIADGTTTLLTALEGQLSPGAATVAAGIEQLGTLVPQLAQVPQFQQLLVGAKTVAGGLAQITNVTKTQLQPGAQALNTGVKTVVGGVAQLAPGATELAKGIQNEVLPGAKAINAGLGTIAAGQKDLATGAGTLQAGASKVAAGNKSLTQSWTKLTNGASDLKAGLTQISAGTATVNTGWGELTAGATALDAGANALKEGSNTLVTSLSGGAEQINALPVTEANIAMFATPVKSVGEKVNSYTYYRDSTAPYVLSLALFVGMLVLSFFVDFKKPATLPGSAISWFASKWLQLALFATIQAVLVSVFALFALDLSATNPGLLILFAILTSITFMSIIFLLVSVGGNIGRFIALVFIVLQLSITGSNLPVDMLPANLQSLSNFLPLTFSNAGFKSVISLGDTSLLGSNASVLAIWLAVTSILALVAFILSYRSLRTSTVSNTADVL